MSRYTVYTTPSALQEAQDLPGHMRQRVKRAVRALADNPRPAGSKELDVPELEHEVRRLKLDKWRVVYARSRNRTRPSMCWPCADVHPMTTATWQFCSES